MSRIGARRRAFAESAHPQEADPQLSLPMDFPDGTGGPESKGRLRRGRKTSDGILHMRDVVKLTGVHRSTVYRWMQLKHFPAKDAPRNRPTGWLRSSYEQWVRGRDDI